MSHSSPSGPAGAPRDYSDRDIRLKPILMFTVYIALFTIIVFAAVRYTMAYWEAQARLADAAVPVMSLDRQLPTTAVLQVNERRDLAAQRAWEAGMLTNYAVVDKDAGIVRIPVERAMNILAERGLPARAAAP
jgi:hypothetical protein